MCECNLVGVPTCWSEVRICDGISRTVIWDQMARNISPQSLMLYGRGEYCKQSSTPSPPHAGNPYPHTDDQRALDSCRAPCFSLPSPHFGAIVTPLEWAKWCYALHDHPDREFVTYIVSGICAGFRIGFQYRSVDCKAATRNMPSASLCEEKIDEFLATECAAGKILSPFERKLVPMVHVSRLGEVPKSTRGNTDLLWTSLTQRTRVSTMVHIRIDVLPVVCLC